MSSPSHSRVTLHVCVTCRRGEEPLEPREARSGAKMCAAITAELARRAASHAVELHFVECLSGCKRGCTAALSSPEKWTYVLGDLDPATHAPDVLTFALQYAAHPEGVPIWRERPEIVRKSVLARVPPMFPKIREAAE